MAIIAFIAVVSIHQIHAFVGYLYVFSLAVWADSPDEHCCSDGLFDGYFHGLLCSEFVVFACLDLVVFVFRDTAVVVAAEACIFPPALVPEALFPPTAFLDLAVLASRADAVNEQGSPDDSLWR